MFSGNLKAEESPVLKLSIKSSHSLSGIAGVFVTVDGEITNSTMQPIRDVTTYLSLVDNENNLPVDLEDWSAEKGVHMPSIASGKTMPFNFKIHFVKAGEYSLLLIATTKNSETPFVSSMVHFHVSPKINLNPGKILPVAIGMPFLLLLLLSSINFIRGRHQKSIENAVLEAEDENQSSR